MKKSNFLFFLFFFTVSSTLHAQWWGKSVRGEGPKVTKTLDLEKITGIGVCIGGEVHLSQGKKQKVEIKAQKNIIELLEKDVRGGKWNIELEDNISLKGHDGIDIYITLSTIEELSIAGSGSITGETDFRNVDDLEVSIAGSGDVHLEGDGDDLEISIAGSGDVKLDDFAVNDCEVNIAGSGECDVHVNGRLEVSIAGSGDVRYKGSPRVKSQIMGSGDVRSY
ncbi:MAG: head GIN domain-containing protein [Bacteroidota bacterium]